MAKVFIPPQWRDLTAGVAEVEFEAATMRQVVRGLDQRFPGLEARISVDDRIVPGLAVSIDGVVTSRGLMARVEPTSEVHFLPAFGGG